VSTSSDKDRRSLREQVDTLLPSWQSWYPSLFDAAQDLGLIRAQVCAPSTLMLSSRHAQVQTEAIQAFKEQWCVEDEPPESDAIPHGIRRHLRNSIRHAKQGRRRTQKRG
jgi:hypothetical protein